MSPINVRISHDDDAVITELFNIEQFADVGAKRKRKHANLLGIQKFILSSFFHIKNFTAQRQNCLIL